MSNDSAQNPPPADDSDVAESLFGRVRDEPPEMEQDQTSPAQEQTH